MNEIAASEGRGAVRREIAPAEPFFAPLIPGLRRLANAYRVSTSEVDAEILDLFVEQLKLVVAALAAAVADRDWNGVRMCAHSLQGMGGTVGAPEISVAGVELSAAAKREEFERCARLLAAIQEWMRLSDPVGSGAASS